MAQILVIGAASVDIKGRAQSALQLGTSVPGDITLSFGGVGRNVAENLARLGQPTVLLSAVGDDPFGNDILESTAAAGVDISNVIVQAGYHSAAYLAILDPTGTQAFAVDEMTTIMNLVTPAYIKGHESLFKGATMLVLDANLSPPALSTAVKAAKRHDVPVVIDPTSTTLAPRVKRHLASLYMVTPNAAEAGALCGHPIAHRSAATAAAQELVAAGVDICIITLAEEGLCYATSRESGYIPAIHCDIVDYTGAGDAVTAAVVYGLVHGFPVDEATRLGVSAATLTLRCPETVCPDLSLERLYDQLVI